MSVYHAMNHFKGRKQKKDFITFVEIRSLQQ